MKTQTTKPIGFREIHTVLSYHEAVTKLQRLENPTDDYPLDRRDVRCYLPETLLPTWTKKITDFFSELKQQQKKIVHADICGRAVAHELGAEKSYIFSFKTPEKQESNTCYVEGDIFCTADFNGFTRMIRKNEDFIALATFMQKAGLKNYGSHFLENDEDYNSTYKKVTFQQFEKRLRSIIEVLVPGGYIVLERPLQAMNKKEFFQKIPPEQYEMSLAVQRIAGELNCTLESLMTSVAGPHYLIRKNL